MIKCRLQFFGPFCRQSTMDLQEASNFTKFFFWSPTINYPLKFKLFGQGKIKVETSLGTVLSFH